MQDLFVICSSKTGLIYSTINGMALIFTSEEDADLALDGLNNMVKHDFLVEGSSVWSDPYNAHIVRRLKEVIPNAIVRKISYNEMSPMGFVVDRPLKD